MRRLISATKALPAFPEGTLNKFRRQWMTSVYVESTASVKDTPSTPAHMKLGSWATEKDGRLYICDEVVFVCNAVSCNAVAVSGVSVMCCLCIALFVFVNN